MSVGDETFRVRRAPGARQVDILFDPTQYSAFPHVVRLDGDELLLAFRQAPKQDVVRHTHPRSVITVIRSPDLGETWDVGSASQLGAGGGQEFSLLYLGKGVVAGPLAKHVVVPRSESGRARIPVTHAHEYAFTSTGVYWARSDSWGLAWRLCDTTLIPGGRWQPSAAPIRLTDGTILCPVYGQAGGGRRGRHSNISSVVLRSDDGGVTWPERVVCARGNRQRRGYGEPALAETGPGRVRALHRGLADTRDRWPRIWSNESVDGGRTWSKPVNTGIISGACPRLLSLRDGRLLLTFGRRQSPFGIRAMISEDGGATWGDTAWVLCPCRSPNQGYTSSVELEPGRVLTTFYREHRHDGDPRRRVTGIAATAWQLP